MRKWRWLNLSILVALLSLSGATRTPAAEQIVLEYGFLSGSVAVADLENLAKTGETSLDLKLYLMLANQKPETLRDILNQEVAVNGELLEGILTTPPGEMMLDRVGEILHTPDKKDNRQALRSAIVDSALPDGNITLLEVLQNYPTDELHINGDRVGELAATIDNAIAQLPDWLVRILIR
ncbi:MAG: alpha/beta hydrolase [Jaaginema sp. PMC 1079.18]|nr:alpha/beta hydrolase [Jaaginema sp. PMC 1080.18]MEC4852741.1 alpha/beta hydrolase [Jaaginema sp. PMC 1079.18]MEC4867935.1 alpha/beta hydrolase [Jaaginema sp. PMC 1078.18]